MIDIETTTLFHIVVSKQKQQQQKQMYQWMTTHQRNRSSSISCCTSYRITITSSCSTLLLVVLLTIIMLTSKTSMAMMIRQSLQSPRRCSSLIYHHSSWGLPKQHQQQREGRNILPATTRISFLYSTSKTTTTGSQIEEEQKKSASTSDNSSNNNEQQQRHTSRLSATGLSLDIKTITNSYDIVYSHMISRNSKNSNTINAIQSIANSSQIRNTYIQQRDIALNERRTLSDEIGILIRKQKEILIKNNIQHDHDNIIDIDILLDTETLQVYYNIMNELEIKKDQSNSVATIAESIESKLDILQNEMNEQLYSIPNLLDDRVPDGIDDTDNEIVSTWGNIYTLPQRFNWPKQYCYNNDTVVNVDNETTNTSNETTTTTTTTWKPLWHDDVASNVLGYMNDAAVQMSGSRFVALRNDIAQLERAIGQWMLDLHTTQHNYIEVSVPYIVSRSTLEGTGQLPKFEEDLFAIKNTSHTCNGEDAFLIPTAEVPITNIHRNDILDEDMLPISYVALTPCFRAEAGSYGRDTKGLIRTHQFHKVELVKITTPFTSNHEHEILTNHAETCLQLLELPYRKVRLCSGDIGFSAQHCYDLEVYLPGSQEYREISSCSNTGDFQARRLALRYRPKPMSTATSSNTDNNDTKKKKGKNTGPIKMKPVLCHTINGSGLAVGRTLVAILENYQCPDGSIVIPNVLRPYMQGKERITKPIT